VEVYADAEQRRLRFLLPHYLFQRAGLGNDYGQQPATSKTMPSPTSQKRRTRRIYLDMAIQYLEKGTCTHRSLVDAIMKQFPNLNRETVSTFVSDIPNPRYSPIKDRKVVKQVDGTLIFEDCVRPMLTVIENPNFAGTENEAEPVTEKQVSGGDL